MSQDSFSGVAEITALLGRGTEFEGKLTFRGRVRIDGTFRGDVTSEDILILGDEARVEGDVEVGTLIVRGGTLVGNVRATQLVEVHSPGKILGDITAPQLFIDRGVTFEGTCTMSGGVVRSLDSGAEVPLPTASEPEASEG